MNMKRITQIVCNVALILVLVQAHMAVAATVSIKNDGMGELYFFAQGTPGCQTLTGTVLSGNPLFLQAGTCGFAYVLFSYDKSVRDVWRMRSADLATYKPFGSGPIGTILMLSLNASQSLNHKFILGSAGNSYKAFDDSNPNTPRDEKSVLDSRGYSVYRDAKETLFHDLLIGGTSFGRRNQFYEAAIVTA